MSATAEPVSRGLADAPSRFLSAWDAFQFAAVHLDRCRKLYALAEIAGHGYQINHYAQEISLAQILLNAAEAEWRKSGRQF